jgi:hypothetical protein
VNLWGVSPLYACPVAMEFNHLHYSLLYSTAKAWLNTFLYMAHQDKFGKCVESINQNTDRRQIEAPAIGN